MIAGPDLVRRNVLWLVVCTAIWGLGFVATARTLASMHPLWSNAVRFLIAAPVGLLVFRRKLVVDRAHLIAAGTASVFLTAAFAFQTWGLRYTSVGRSSLITGLYAVFTPLCAPLFRAPPPRVMHFVGAVVAFAGLSVLGGAWQEGDAGLNLGDALTLGCALVSVGHIYVVAKVAPGRDPFALNALQVSFCALWSLILALLFGGPPPTSMDTETLVAMSFLAVFSSVVAFGIQMMAQQVLSASTAATLLLMEAPFGVLFGVLLLSETLAIPQLLGGALMLGGCILSVRADADRN
ncbi:MAG: DMT family transporter [Myxococcota bacterium]